MTSDQIRELHGARPFVPFLIHLADGRELRVPHPELLAIGPANRTVIVFRPDESHDYVDVRLITSIEVREDHSESA